MRLHTTLLAIAAAALLAACDESGAAGTPTPVASATPDVTRASPGAASGARLPSELRAAEGITVRETAAATLRADRAYAVALYIQRAPGAPARAVTAKDRESLEAALSPLGVRREAISVESDARLGSFTAIRVELPILDLPTKGRTVLDAVERVLGRADGTGATFALQSCASASDPPRRDTFSMATERAHSLAAAAGVTLGPLIAVAEQRSATTYPGGDPCDDHATPQAGPSGLQPLDAAPQVPFALELQVTYRIAGAEGANPGRSIVVSGAGQATATANIAFVVLMIEPTTSTTVQPTIASKDRAAFIDRMVALGVAVGDIELGAPTLGGPIVISAEVPLARLPKIGEDIVDAATRAFGRPSVQGVRFSHTECEFVRSAAHKQALAEARIRALSLATAGGARLGTLRAVVELAGGGAPGSPSGDPCHPAAAALASGAYGAVLRPFDATPQFTIEAILSATYALD